MGASEKPLQGRVAVVTGASRGLGRGIAMGMGEAGATVYVTGRTERPDQSTLPGTIGRTAEEVTRLGGQGIAVRCDHGIDSEVQTLFERIHRENARLDIVVNNVFALIPPDVLWGDRPFWETPRNIWDDLIDIGLRSHYIATWFAASIMVAQRGGLIVNVSSAGATQKIGLVPYGVGKAGLDRLTADTAEELRRYEVAVVSVWPPRTKTEAYAAEAEASEDPGSYKPPLLTGRVVAALASDPSVMTRSGKAFRIADLAAEWGIAEPEADRARGDEDAP